MKGHSITVSIISKSGEDVNQEILLTEYAYTPEELMMKNFAITDAVIPALDAAMKKMAAEAGNAQGNVNVPPVSNGNGQVIR